MLDAYINENGIKPHALYWKIYGKAEGVRTSYITRDFLSYCLRIKRYFKQVSDIRELFPSLRKYSLFRGAFPLLENNKYKLNGEQEARIIKVLNSKQSIKEILLEINNVKHSRIGIRNTRTQKLNEMKPITDNFVAIYNSVYSLIKDNEKSLALEVVHRVGKEYLNSLSQSVSALTQENLYNPDLQPREDLAEQWVTFATNLRLLHEAPVETRNRFRRLVPPRKMDELADMLNAFISEGGITNYRKRKGLV